MEDPAAYLSASMAAYREDRRRKLLRDDVRAASTETNASETANRRVTRKRLYAEEALHSHQPRITDLIPQRRFSLIVFWLGGFVVPAALTAIYFLVCREGTGQPAAPADTTLRLVAVGSLSRWWCSVMFLFAAMLCGLIYHLRRYKLDDYRGRYRFWALLIPVFILASADVATNLHDVVHEQWVARTSHSHFAALQSWGFPLSVVALALVAIRLAWEMWPSRGASVVFFLSAVSYGVATWAWCAPGHWSVRFTRDLTMFLSIQIGLHQLIFSLVMYLRYVYQTAQGSRARGRKRQSVEMTEDSNQRSRASKSRKPSQARQGDSTGESLERRSPSATGSNLASEKTHLSRKEMRRQQRRAA